MLGIKKLSREDFHIKPVPRKGCGYALGQECEYRTHAIFQFPHFFSERNVSAEVLQNHTLYPLTAALGRTRADSVVTPAVWRKICPDCASEDFENYGTAYVHRSHVPKSVRVCSVHGSRLMDKCTTCSTLLRKHEISRLGVCSQRYQSHVQEPDSVSLAYSKFVAGLLNYDGPAKKSHEAEWIIRGSVRLKYGNEIDQEDGFIAKLIKREFGLEETYPLAYISSDNSYTIRAFLGCETAEKYLNLITNKEATHQLERDLTLFRREQHRAALLISSSSSGKDV